STLRPSWHLGMSLLETMRGRVWQDHRAIIEVVGGSGPRSYAIGDLLPYGAMVVGISTGAVQLMVADNELVGLSQDGGRWSLEDFQAADEVSSLRLVPDDPVFREAVHEVQAFLRSEDPREVQGAIDALIAAGPAAVGPLIPYAESLVPVVTATYAFAGTVRRPGVYSDLVIGIIMAITGHSFGDPMGPGLSESERAWIREQWSRWWGPRRD
ncbi:MAG: hypothetical protein AAFV29_00895, partial [Myxococcota bacterium]